MAHPQFINFRKHIETQGFCFIANEKYSDIRFYNRFSDTTLPDRVIPLRFRKWDSQNTPNAGITEYLRASLPLVAGNIFAPSKEAFVEFHGSTWCNTYRRFKPATGSKEVSPLFLEFFERLFPNPQERHTCLQWLAHIFQRPSDRPSWQLMLVSESGTGKGFLFHSILKPLLIHCKIASSYRQITQQFSTILEDSLLCLLDDPKSASDETMTRIKSALSEESAMTEHKGLQAKTISTYTRFILASNEERPLRLDSEDRRWFAPSKIMHSHSKEETQQFIERLAKWLTLLDSLSEVYNWFMAYDLTGFNYKHVAQSSQIQKIIGMSKNALDDVYLEFFEQRDVFHVNDLLVHIQNEGYTRPQNSALNQAMCQAGYQSFQLTSNGIRKRFWVKAGLDKKQAQEILKKRPICTDAF